MFRRMKAVVVSPSMGGQNNEQPFGLVLVHYGAAGSMNYEVVGRSDLYALCDFWATMFNIGKVTDIEEVKAGLEKGLAGVEQDPAKRLAAMQPTEGQPDGQ